MMESRVSKCNLLIFRDKKLEFKWDWVVGNVTYEMDIFRKSCLHFRLLYNNNKAHKCTHIYCLYTCARLKVYQLRASLL